MADAETGDPLPTATVTNISTQQSVFSNDEGNFEILAHTGDKLAFTYMGYKADQMLVTESSAYTRLHIDLKQQAYKMQELIVRPKYTPYQADSIERASTYRRTMLRQHEGSLASPVTFLAERLSRSAQQRFRFQKEFRRLEDERFTDTRYTPEVVTQLTTLTGDTLAHFMNAYPVPYDYARAASELEFKMWIRTNYREWIAKGRPIPHIVADSTFQKN